MHEGTPGSGAGSNTFHLLGLLGSQGAHALQTGPQLTVSLSSAGGTLAIADGTDAFQFHPSQVGYDRASTNTLAEVPGAGNSTPEATPSQLQGALAPGGAIARQQGGVAKAGPPSPGQRYTPVAGPLNSNRMVDEEGMEVGPQGYPGFSSAPNKDKWKGQSVLDDASLIFSYPAASLGNGGLGLLQGGANLVNGVQDSGVGLINVGIYAFMRLRYSPITMSKSQSALDLSIEGDPCI